MLNNAIERLKKEMDKNKNNSYVQVVGGFLLQYLEKNPEAAEKILSAEKNIAKSLDAMKKEASKKKVGNCGVLTDQEGFQIVLQYYGLEAVAPIAKIEAIPVKKARIDFNISLEDLL